MPLECSRERRMFKCFRGRAPGLRFASRLNGGEKMMTQLDDYLDAAKEAALRAAAVLDAWRKSSR